MPIITIGGTPIDFPNTGRTPVWSESVIQFAQAVESALSGIVSTGDVAKQSFVLTSSHNPGTNITLTGLSFSTALVRAGFIRYSVYRTTSTTQVYEAGEMTVIYNASNPATQKWELQQERVSDASITFSIDDAGQFSFSTSAIAGASHTGLISFVAQSLAQS